jgi:hypothetical protein
MAKTQGKNHFGKIGLRLLSPYSGFVIALY